MYFVNGCLRFICWAVLTDILPIGLASLEEVKR